MVFRLDTATGLRQDEGMTTNTEYIVQAARELREEFPDLTDAMGKLNGWIVAVASNRIPEAEFAAIVDRAARHVREFEQQR